ncbi:MAG: substrate-binding domain-containing protein [Patescibacteria group bacterium]|nr:substrate-binding domain-containing protein [Patescibacteria group bacterium]MDE1946099.1 substrate-binding domain-containing protein [Patescibacteria group bacterium]
MKKFFIASAVIIVIALGVAVFFMGHQLVPVQKKGPGDGLLIGFSLGTLQEERWQRDRDEFVKQANALGAVVDVESSENNVATQVSQIEGMIVKGVNILVIAPYDATSLTSVVNDAHKAGIKVISYDRLITNTPIDLYVSFDNQKIGEYEAQSVVNALSGKLGKGKPLAIAYIGGSLTDNNAILVKQGAFKVLQPLIDKGEIKIVLDKFTPNWNPENAYKNLKAYLDASGAVDGVVAANDGTAFGSIEALHEHGLDGKVPVSGQDAEISALQRIIAGTQAATVYKPIVEEDAAAVAAAIELAKGEPLSATTTPVNNGVLDVPSVLLPSVEIVTKDNIADTVIKDGYYTTQEIYGSSTHS